MRKIYFSLIVAALALSSGLALRAQLPHQVDTWALRGTSPDNRVGAAAVALADGRTLITGGTIDGVATDTAVIYDPATGSFSSVGQLLAARTGHTATLLDDGRVLIAGGTINSILSGDLEVFDATAGTSTLAATMAELRSGHAAARLADGTVLIAGGTGTAGVLQSAEIFDPSTGTVSMVSSMMQSARTSASATTLIDGRVLITGGNDGNVDLASAEIFYAATQYFQPTDTTLSVPRRGHSALLLPNNGSVLIAGGSSNGDAKASADLFVPAQFPDPYSYGMGRFASTAAMAAPRVGAVGAPGLEGYALAIGGGSSDAEAYRFATIKTDKDDYAPGVKAVISGSGWKPGEEVTLLFQEDPAVHDDYLLATTADGNGNIYYDQWAPEEHDLGVRFYLMATGQQSGRRAQTTFTDDRDVKLDNPALVWHRTGEVPAVPDGFNVSVNGTYSCSPGGGANNCTSVTNLTITVSGVAGSKVLTGLVNGDDVVWATTLEFRTSPGAGQFAIPADGQPNVTATLNASPAPTFVTRNNYFGVDNTKPVTNIQCNGVACASPYNAAVLVTLTATDGPGSSSSGVASRLYCIDETNTCVPALSYPNAGFSVAFVAGVTKFVRYSSTDDAGNVETTKSQAIQFQAATFDVTFNATPIADVPVGTTVLSVTVGAGPAVTVTQGELPKTFADLASGTNVSYSYISPLAVSAAKQYRWLSTAGTGSASGQTTQSGGPFSVTADSTVTATYKAQHLLTFNLSGVDADYTGTVVNIGGSPIASTSFVSNSYTQWIDDGAAAPSVVWTDPLTSSVTGKQYDFVNATPASFTSPVTAAQTMTANYQKQWQLTLNLSGVDADYTGTVVTINGSPILAASFGSNSYSQWVDHATPLTLVWQDPLASTVTGKQYDFLATTPALVTSMTFAQTLTANYQKQWLLTFNLSGVDADYTGPVVTIGLSTIASASFVSNSYTQWVNDGPAPSVSWTDPLLSSLTGKRYDFLNATPLTTPVAAPQTITANYQKQWLLTFTLSGVDADYTGTVVTIGGSPIASTSFLSNSYTRWVDDGSTAPSVAWTDPVTSSVTGKQYLFVNATPENLTTPVTAPQTMTAAYQKQWLLTFNLSGVDGDYTGLVVTIAGSPKLHTAFTSNSYSQWVNDGSSPTVAWQDPLASTVPGKQYDFLNTTPASLATPITAAQTLTANYQKQWLLTFNLSGVDADYTGTVVTIGSPIASTSFVSNSYSQWVNHSSSPTVTWEPTLASSVAGKRYVFVNATPLAIPVTAPQTLTANYQKQWQLTWTQTGLAGTGAHAVVTVNGSPNALASPLFFGWFNDGASVSYVFHTPISTDPASSTQFELTNGGTLPSSPITVSGTMTIEGAYSSNLYTIQYLSPLDQSEGTNYQVNTGKNGRVIPVKVLLFKNGVAISDTSTVIMRAVGSNCEAGSGTDPIEEYADAGASSGGTNLFRWSAPHWIYNLDTRAVGMANNSCYRLDVYIGSVMGPTAIKASAARWAIFKAVK